MRANLPIPMDVYTSDYEKAIASPPDPLTRGSAPRSSGGSAPDPRYRLALRALAMGLSSRASKK